MIDDRRHDEDGARGEHSRLGEDGRGEEALRDDFRALRAEVQESGTVPDFDSMMVRVREEARASTASADRDGAAPQHPRRTRAGWGRLGWWIPVAAAAAVVGMLLLDAPDSDAEADFERLVADYSTEVEAWRPPTAPLLDIPGVDLGSVPSIGSPLGGGERPKAEAPEGRDS
jgi:hypothetical protein